MKEWSIPKASPTARAGITAQEARTTAQTEAATAPQVRPAARLCLKVNVREASRESVLTSAIFFLSFSVSFSGSQNPKKGTRAPKIPKHNVVSWGEALSPPPLPHVNAWDCDEYSLPMERR